MYVSKYILIMCNSLKIIIKNTFSCCADISQPFTLTITAILHYYLFNSNVINPFYKNP